MNRFPAHPASPEGFDHAVGERLAGELGDDRDTDSDAAVTGANLRSASEIFHCENEHVECIDSAIKEFSRTMVATRQPARYSTILPLCTDHLVFVICFYFDRALFLGL